MGNRLEIDYDGDEELHAVVCRPPSGKLYLHLTDEPGEIHGAETAYLDPDISVFFGESSINDVDA